MITFTSAIAIPNLTKARIKLPFFDHEASEARFALVVEGPGGRVYATLPIVVRNGSCQGVRATVGPVTFADYIQEHTVTAATGFTNAAAAYNTTNGSIANRLQAVETALLDDGIIAIAGTVS